MRWLFILAGLYIFVCILLYFFQEHFLFFPEKTDRNKPFQFGETFTEINFTMKDGKVLNGVLFKSKRTKGLIFYLHGNGGSISSWSDVSEVYTSLGYDLFLLDYRGYGKSEGEITSEAQLHEDMQAVFKKVSSAYDDKKVIVLGYSLGSCLAAKLAVNNQVDRLILQAPYYSMTDMMNEHYKILPPFILRYKLDTYKYVQQCRRPIVIFHGDKDELISYESSLKLKKYLKDTDTLIRLKGLGHNRITFDEQYTNALEKVLAEDTISTR
jgi:uncharacterized protein